MLYVSTTLLPYRSVICTCYLRTDSAGRYFLWFCYKLFIVTMVTNAHCWPYWIIKGNARFWLIWNLYLKHISSIQISDIYPWLKIRVVYWMRTLYSSTWGFRGMTHIELLSILTTGPVAGPEHITALLRQKAVNFFFTEFLFTMTNQQLS